MLTVSNQPLDWRYFPQSRIDLLIACLRSIFAFCSLVAIWVDPSEPSCYAEMAYGLMLVYLAYSIMLTAFVWSASIQMNALGFITHALDIISYTALLYFTEGPTSPFFLFFTFAVLSGTLRWHCKGAVYTAGICLLAYLCLGLLVVQAPHADFDYSRFIIRGVYLAVIGVLLGYMGRYQKSLLGVMEKLAELPKVDHHDIGCLLRKLLEHACKLTGARRALVIWDDPEEPWRNLAYFDGTGYQSAREAPDLFGGVVAEPLSSKNFLCHDVSLPECSVLCGSPNGFTYFRGAGSLDPELVSHYTMCSVMSLRLEAERASGRLFLLDKRRMTSDDLLLGIIISNRMSILLNQHYLVEELNKAAILEERIRLARDLHDGLLQSLTGIALKTQATDSLIDQDPVGAHNSMEEILNLLSLEQHDIRRLIHELKPRTINTLRVGGDFHSRLRDLAAMIASQWRLPVEFDLPMSIGCIIPDELRQPVYFILRESLVNCAKHAGAAKATATIRLEDGCIKIRVEDDGRGFPYHGRYGHAELCARKLGPASIRERVVELDGVMRLESGRSGACLEISIPLILGGSPPYDGSSGAGR